MLYWPIRFAFIFSCHLILFLTNQICFYFLMSSDNVLDQSGCVFSHVIWFCSWPIRLCIFSCHLIMFLTNQICFYFLMASVWISVNYLIIGNSDPTYIHMENPEVVEEDEYHSEYCLCYRKTYYIWIFFIRFMVCSIL